MIKIGYVQTNPLFGVKEVNFEQVRGILRGVKADLIVLPELFATGYAFKSKEEVDKLAEDINGETSEFLKEISISTGAVIVAGFAEKFEGDCFNSSIIIKNNEVIGNYHKIHLYYKEKKWFKPGDEVPEPYDLNGMKLGVMICFDWFFPEVMRTISLKGADIVAHPANLVMPYCQNAMITRCLVNRVYCITSNRIGREKRGFDDFKFTGRSQITSYNGEVLSSAPINEIGADFVEIEVENSRNKQLNQYNDVFQDRRPKLYRL